MSKATRQAFGERLAALGETHPEIVVFDADLAKSTKSELFGKKFKDRFFEMGIAEANMIGTAAGMAFMGKLPFLCSFGCFLTGRYDTIRLSVAYSGANVRLVGTHAGVGIGDDGHSQMGLEDIALMRALPTMGVFQPMDATETEFLMDYLVEKWKGPAYLRLTRQNLPNLMPPSIDKTKYDPLKLIQVFEPASKPKIAVVATGATVTEAVGAAQNLSKNPSQSVSVWNACSLKPFDSNTLLKIAKEVSLVVTVEDHSVIGGLGACAAETLSKVGSGPRLITLGIQDQFGESGEPIELYDKHGISSKKIQETLELELRK